MITESVARTINRELNTLRDEIMAYANDAELWVTPGGVSNSAGNLALHICGNLQYLIGAVLGDTGYVRDRDAEFSRCDVSQNEIVAEINTTADAVATTLAALDSETLAPLRGWFDTHVPAEASVEQTDLISTRDAEASGRAHDEGERAAPYFEAPSDFDEVAAPGPVPSFVPPRDRIMRR